jgi:hypothetical protein
MPIIPQLQPFFLKAAAKKGTGILILLMLLMVGFKLLIFDLVIPKTANLTTPPKWRMMPLRQNREILLDYFGNPEKSQERVDEWLAGRKGKIHQLRVYYSADSIAVAYAIRYRYRNFLFAKEYVLDSNDIR